MQKTQLTNLEFFKLKYTANYCFKIMILEQKVVIYCKNSLLLHTNGCQIIFKNLF